MKKKKFRDPPPSSSMERQAWPTIFDWDPWDPEKSQEYENLKIDMILNPFGVLGPINSGFDDFSKFRSFLVLFARFFKNGLEN